MYGFTNKTKKKPKNQLENKAYQLGIDHFIIGDEVKNIDYLSNIEILKLIKN